MKILLSEAHLWTPGIASRSKIYEDARHGRLSTSTHPKNEKWKAVDIAELERVYGKVSDPEVRQKDSEVDGTGQQKHLDKLIQAYEDRIADLQSQLEKSSTRETELLQRLKDEQQNVARILPPERKVSWIRRLFGFSEI